MWHFRFIWIGKQQRVAVGSYPKMSLKDAREQRDDLRAQTAHGVDPRVHRLHFKAAELAAPLNTFACVFKAWRDFKALNLKTGRQSTLSQIDRIFAKDVPPQPAIDIVRVRDRRARPSPRTALPAVASQPPQGTHQRNTLNARCIAWAMPAADRAWHLGDDFHGAQRAG